MLNLDSIALVLSLFTLIVKCTNVVLSNDDGWAEINVRILYQSLSGTGDLVVLSAPAENESGTGITILPLRTLRVRQKLTDHWREGSSDAPAIPLTKTCEFNSCPSGSPAEGNNASDTRLNYVNSYPATSMRYGIQTLAPKYFGGPPDIAVAGFNVGGKSCPSDWTLF